MIYNDSMCNNILYILNNDDINYPIINNKLLVDNILEVSEWEKKILSIKNKLLIFNNPNTAIHKNIKMLQEII
jgi:hypothetical protein